MQWLGRESPEELGHWDRQGPWWAGKLAGLRQRLKLVEFVYSLSCPKQAKVQERKDGAGAPWLVSPGGRLGAALGAGSPRQGLVRSGRRGPQGLAQGPAGQALPSSSWMEGPGAAALPPSGAACCCGCRLVQARPTKDWGTSGLSVAKDIQNLVPWAVAGDLCVLGSRTASPDTGLSLQEGGHGHLGSS